MEDPRQSFRKHLLWKEVFQVQINDNIPNYENMLYLVEHNPEDDEPDYENLTYQV